MLKAQTRQGLLILAMVGLFLSSFALQTLQGAMQGLQNSQLARGKRIEGQAVLQLKGAYQAADAAAALQKKLAALGWKGYLALEEEVLLRHANYLAPGLGRAFAELPPFLQDKEVQDMVLTRDLAYSLQALRGETISLISPVASHFFLTEIPQEVSGEVSDFIAAQLPAIDATHFWPRPGLMQNLIRQKIYNRLVFYTPGDFKVLRKLLQQETHPQDLVLETWEEQNDTLVWSLKLEHAMMVFLFSAMAFLVSLSITSGMMAFLAKVKEDLAAFWLLGASAPRLARSVRGFIYLSSAIAVVGGVVSAIIFLQLLSHGHFFLMPAEFVDRTIPSEITLPNVLRSFLIPYLMAVICGQYVVRKFMAQTSYLALVRKDN
ncbi:MAG: hypothetical protein J6Y94_08135 [Bacteriovoracaceae bacterium]|nr:hypothetical protein [Bacteriovoracaceae bacterium]